MFLFVVAFIGGAVSVLTPCVLPLLPAILAVSGTTSARRVWGIVAGIELSFFGIAILLASAISSLGLPKNVLQYVAAASLGVFGLVLAIGKLHDAFAAAASRLTSRLPQRSVTGTGFLAGLGSGLPLGLVWAPCAGPILAGITVAASTSRFSARTYLALLGYALGMVGPLAAVVFGGQRLSQRLRRALGGGRRVLVPMGIVLLITAVVIGSGWLNTLDQFIARRINLTSTPTAALEHRALSTRSTPSAPTVIASGLPDLGAAPEVSGITRWYNTDDKALTIRSLRGKVVLVDFWTYSCINCIRTLPHIKALYAKYAKDGFVVLGVHSPEFEFEKDPGNVGRAIRDFGIHYPVALDANLATWNNFSNEYWPAHYLVDRNGRVRAMHAGEGAYDETENQVRELLGERPHAVMAESTDTRELTPETYIGYERAERLAKQAVPDREVSYDPPRDDSGQIRLDPDAWAFAGTWTVGPKAAVAGTDAQIYLHFRAANVFIVAGPADGGSGSIDSSGPNGARHATIDGDRLYTVRSGEYTDGLLRLNVSPGVRVFSFTFG